MKHETSKVTYDPANHRDYNEEWQDNQQRKYAYDFDFQVMHRFMLESFVPHFRGNSILELGSFKGDFTARLLEHFLVVDCIEASSDAVSEARIRLGDRVRIVEGTFEQVALDRKYDNIILTHVLEHVDDPIGLLRRIKDEWLSESGRLFLVCPNANAASRQIAVKMGIVDFNAAITEPERLHGHRATYSFDTLENIVQRAGMNVVSRNGIFFKALANYQWDQVLKAEIVSDDYLVGCYKLGQLYPELCASIFLLCDHGSR